MFKKVAIVGAAGLLTAAALTQTKLGDYASTLISRAEHHLESKISPDENIREIKKEVAALDKDIEKARSSFAEETVEVRFLKKKVDQMKIDLEKAREAVDNRGKMMKEASQNKPVKWDNAEIPYSKAKELLAREVSTFKNMQKQYESESTMLAVRERSRQLADQHLQALVTQKAELTTAVTELEADIKLAKIEQVESKYQNDGTRMAGVKKSLADLRKKIEIQREKLDLTRKMSPDSIENKSVDEILAGLDSKSSKNVDQVGLK